MMRSILVACLTAFVVTAPVFAQQMEDSQADEPDEPRPAPAVCLIGEHSGFPEADARTAALLVCDELRKQGIPVGEPVYRAPYSASGYRVGLHRLGQKVLVRLSQENPVGTVLIERQLQLGNIEEMIPAAPRLVDALVHRKSLASTVDVESVVEQEARVLRKIPSQVSGEIGIFGIYGLGTGEDVGVKPGLKIAGSYERPSYAVGFEFGVAGRIEIDGETIELPTRHVPISLGASFIFGGEQEDHR